MRYNYFVADNKVVCVSHYAGKAVRGIAKCDPKDEFNLDDGKDLAQARCDLKIADKRLKRSNDRYAEACALVEEAMAYKARMEDYQRESLDEYVVAKQKLVDLEIRL